MANRRVDLGEEHQAEALMARGAHESAEALAMAVVVPGGLLMIAWHAMVGARLFWEGRMAAARGLAGAGVARLGFVAFGSAVLWLAAGWAPTWGRGVV